MGQLLGSSKTAKIHFFTGFYSGCGEDLLPHEFPPWRTVDQVVQQWQQDGTWDRLQSACRQAGLVPAGATLPTQRRTDERTLSSGPDS